MVDLVNRGDLFEDNKVHHLNFIFGSFQNNVIAYYLAYRITKNLEGVVIDRSYKIDDREAMEIIFALNQLEGICLGGSSGINIAGAIHLARELGPGHTIVTILCDFGTRYQSKLFNPAFLKEKGLPVPAWLDSAPLSLGRGWLAT